MFGLGFIQIELLISRYIRVFYINVRMTMFCFAAFRQQMGQMNANKNAICHTICVFIDENERPMANSFPSFEKLNACELKPNIIFARNKIGSSVTISFALVSLLVARIHYVRI